MVGDRRRDPTAPTLQPPLLATPRWSTRGQISTSFNVVSSGITPTAELASVGRTVSVGPPLFAKAPRSSVLESLMLWLAALKPQEPSSSAL